MFSKSANQLWKESGTVLSFKDWLNREKEKNLGFDGGVTGGGQVILNAPLNNSIKQTLADIRSEVGYKQTPSNNTVFGLNKTVVIVAAVVVVAAITYAVIKSKKK